MRRKARRQPQAPFPRDSDWEMELDQAAVTYPGAVPVRALRPVSLQFAAGETVAVAGRSGSGKSTLLNVLGLLDRPTGGRYLVRGVDTSLLSESGLTALRGREFGFVFQSFHLLADRTGGEQQRVAIARALAQQPRVLLCDEPTGNLDRKNAELVTNLLRGLAAEGLTVIMVTHDLEIAAGMLRFLDIDDGLVTERDPVNR